MEIYIGRVGGNYCTIVSEKLDIKLLPKMLFLVDEG